MCNLFVSELTDAPLSVYIDVFLLNFLLYQSCIHPTISFPASLCLSLSILEKHISALNMMM